MSWGGDWTPERVNLATNPRAGAGATTGWDLTGLSTLEAVTLDGATHPDPLMLPDGTVIDTAIHCITTDAAGTDRAAMLGLAMVDGLPYGYRVYVWGVGTTDCMAVILDASGAIDVQAVSVADQWEELDLSGIATVDGDGQVQVREIAASGTVEWYFTAAMVEQSGELGSYFDGDTSNAEWDGADHASTSTLHDVQIVHGHPRRQDQSLVVVGKGGTQFTM